MSFRVFAAGTGHFNFTRENNPDMDIFTAASVMSALRAGGPSVRGVAEGVADYVVPSDTGVMRDGIAAIAQMEFLHMLKNSVEFLAMCSGSSNGWISVAPRVSHLGGLWPDTCGFAKYNFSPGDSPGSEFFQTVRPALEATDMNNYGVLRIMAIILSRYADHIGDNGTPMIQIQLFK